MIIEIGSDSKVWSEVKSALRGAGYRYMLQQNLFDPNRTSLFIEPQAEPEGGVMKHGLIVYPGGCEIGSTIEEVRQQEINR